MKRGGLAVAAVFSLLVGALRADDPLAAAKSLYAAAAYEEALAAFSKLKVEAPQGTDGREARQYVAFCLTALGRTAEAEQAMQELVLTDPLYRLPAEEASPRLQAAFEQVRQRVLPRAVQERYTAAKAVYDHQQFDDAVQRFDEVLKILDAIGPAADVGDLRTLASGFRQLAATARDQAAQEAARRAAAVAAAAAAAAPPKIYHMGDAGVRPPVAIRQDVPPAELGLPHGSLTGGSSTATIEILIDEAGNVEQATIRQSANKMYDSRLLKAARGWRYEPAQRDGKPVKFLKLINVTIRPPAS